VPDATLSERLHLLRKEADMTQTELADAIGLGRVVVSHYEKGNRWPQAEGLIKIAKFFDCTTDYLLGISNYRQYPTEDVKTIADRLILEIEEATNKAKKQLKEGDQAETSKRNRKRLPHKRKKVKAMGSSDNRELVSKG